MSEIGTLEVKTANERQKDLAVIDNLSSKVKDLEARAGEDHIKYAAHIDNLYQRVQNLEASLALPREQNLGVRVNRNDHALPGHVGLRNWAMLAGKSVGEAKDSDEGKLQTISERNGLRVSCVKEGHRYLVEKIEAGTDSMIDTMFFQEGTIPEKGVNGLTNEIVIDILIDRITGLNSKFPCHENVDALQMLSMAQARLIDRTRDRTARGVEGKHVI